MVVDDGDEGIFPLVVGGGMFSHEISEGGGGGFGNVCAGVGFLGDGGRGGGGERVVGDLGVG